MIQINHFGWRFADAHESALHDVNLGIQPGEFLVVAGPSGSGKTTLALAMCGLLVGRHDGHAAGTVWVDGLDVAATPLPEIAQRIALVQQNPEAQFATLTVSDEVAFGLENRCVSPDEIRRRSTDAMNLLGVTHLRDRSLATLSGGEQQRVAIASIMAGNPSVVVLDEPTASLDPQAARDFFRVLADLRHSQGLTVIVIEHKLAQLRPHRPRLISLVAGSVARTTVFEYPLAASLSAEPQSHSRSTLDERGGNVGCPASPIPNPTLTSDATTSVVHGPQSPAPRLAELANITVSLGGRKVLDNVSLAVSPGDVIAILGPNGSGKTTLLHCLLGLVKPDAGSVSACGSTVTPRNVSSRVVNVGVVLQNADHQLVADSVIEEALFTTRTLGLWTRGSVSLTDHCVRLFEQAGILNRRDDHPYRLSWGQKRRLNLISAVLHRPQLLLLDEPFAGQDWDNAEFLLNVIRTVVSGVADIASRSPPAPRGACLLVTHDSRFVTCGCTRVVFVSEGCILLDAPLPDALTRLREMNLDAYLPDEPAC